MYSEHNETWLIKSTIHIKLSHCMHIMHAVLLESSKLLHTKLYVRPLVVVVMLLYGHRGGNYLKGRKAHAKSLANMYVKRADKG